jgi:hypothetical protein
MNVPTIKSFQVQGLVSEVSSGIIRVNPQFELNFIFLTPCFSMFCFAITVH